LEHLERWAGRGLKTACADARAARPAPRGAAWNHADRVPSRNVPTSSASAKARRVGLRLGSATLASVGYRPCRTLPAGPPEPGGRLSPVDRICAMSAARPREPPAGASGLPRRGGPSPPTLRCSRSSTPTSTTASLTGEAAGPPERALPPSVPRASQLCSARRSSRARPDERNAEALRDRSPRGQSSHFLRPYRNRGDMANVALTMSRWRAYGRGAAQARESYRGIGEFHLSAGRTFEAPRRQAGFAVLAEQRNIFWHGLTVERTSPSRKMLTPVSAPLRHPLGPTPGHVIVGADRQRPASVPLPESLGGAGKSVPTVAPGGTPRPRLARGQAFMKYPESLHGRQPTRGVTSTLGNAGARPCRRSRTGPGPVATATVAEQIAYKNGERLFPRALAARRAPAAGHQADGPKS